MEVINNFASSIVEKLIALLTTYPGWIQLLIVLGIAILVLCGVIYLIKKSWKLLVTIVSIALVGLVIYWFVLK